MSISLPPYPKAHLYPPALKDVLYDFWWDVDKLFALQLPTQTISIEQLLWHLSLPIWTYNGRQFAISPNDVLASPMQYAEHFNRVLRADLDYPIVVRKDGDRIIVVDGCHRLVKAHLNGQKEIKASVMSKEYERLIAHTD